MLIRDSLSVGMPGAINQILVIFVFSAQKAVMKSSIFKLITFTAGIFFVMNGQTQTKDNQLTEQQRKEGWTLLFDGTGTDAWRTYRNQEADSWEVVDGQLHCKKDGVQHRADLVTRQQYGDFELAIDWKVDPGANSGIIYRANEDHNASYESGPEYQLIDDIGYPGKLEDWQKSGSDYDMHPPALIASHKAGVWNHTVIRARGNHVEHWLNGKKVTDFEIGSPDWLERKQKSKWKDIPGWGQEKQGYICLQDHGGGIWFKNIRIRKL